VVQRSINGVAGIDVNDDEEEDKIDIDVHHEL